MSVKLYAICVVKNEADIIGQTLTFAMQYCDRIFVIDNGSTDQTWEIVRSLAREHRAIVPFEQVSGAFHNGLRARIYNSFHHELSDDDWWLMLDSDEFLAEDPGPIIEGANREGADVVHAWQIQFFFTEQDFIAWENGMDTRDRPIFERRRYYMIDWQESRLFRNRTNEPWNTTVSSWRPEWLKKVYHRRILNRHYQFRDPEQIQKRLELRFGHPTSFRHVTSTDWKAMLRDSRTLNYYHDGDAWRFSLRGLLYYYRRKGLKNMVKVKVRGAKKRLHDLLGTMYKES
jgi:glycosyltransferase involved in cell wall biosynthesis